MSEADNDELPPILTAFVHDVRYFVALLRGVNFVNRATVTITSAGLTIHVEEARSLLATAFVVQEIFDEYSFNPPASQASTQHSSTSTQGKLQENVTFEIQLNILIDCLNIFGISSNPSAGWAHKKWRRTDRDDGGNHSDDDGREGRQTGPIEKYFASGGSEKMTGMRMSYSGAGYPLTLLVAEDSTGPTTTCEIATFDPEDILELPFETELTILRVILKSSWLRDALSELDPSFEKLTFIATPPTDGARAPNGRAVRATAKPMFRIQAAGTSGSTEMDYPNDRDVLETFDCERTVKFSYRFAHISRVLRALQNSTKTSIRIDEDGLLSLQLIIPNPGSREMFIDFRCLPLDDDA